MKSKHNLLPMSGIIGMVIVCFAIATPAYADITASATNDTPTVSTLLNRDLAGMQAVVERMQTKAAQGQSIDADLLELRTYSDSIAGHYQTILTSFTENEAKLQRLGLSGAKLARLQLIRDEFSAKYAGLQEKLTAALAAPTSANLAALRTMVDGLLPEERHQPLGVNLPNRSIRYEPLLPALGAGSGQSVYGGKFSLPAGITPLSAAPTTADLAPTPETKLTPELLEKISYLDSQPLKLYSWVRNNIDYEPYYGSIKGAALTLADQSGNDLDQASLLIALLRGAGIPCRYAYGTVTMPVSELMNWAGVCDTQTAFTLMATGAGVPIAPGYQGSELVEVKLEHVWVVAWVDYFPSRGAVQREGDCWIPLDPSFKEYTELRGTDITGSIGFNTAEYLAAVNDTSPVMVYLDAADRYLRENVSETAISLDASYYRLIKAKREEMLSANLNHRTDRIVGLYDAVPEILKHKWRFQVGGIDHTATLAEIGRNRVALMYVPATLEDSAVIGEYGGIYGAPPYLVNFRPQLEIKDIITVTGQPVQSGEDQTLRMEYLYPGNEVLDAIENPVTAGAYYGIGIAGKKVSTDVVVKSADAFIAMVDQLNIEDTQAMVAVDDNMMKELLYLSAISYFYQLNAGEDLLTGIMQIEKLKQPSEAMCGFDVGVDYSLGVPVDIYPTGFFVDVDRNVYAPFAVDGDQNKTREFMVVAGYTSSVLEHKLFEQRYGLQAVSAIRALQLANAQGIPVHTVTRENCATVLLQLQVAEALKAEIRDLVNQGLEVTLPEHNLQVEDWNGLGYLVLNPRTGAGGYMISGGMAGAKVTIIDPRNHEYAYVGYEALIAFGKKNGTLKRACFIWGDIATASLQNASTLLECANMVAHSLGYLSVVGAGYDEDAVYDADPTKRTEKLYNLLAFAAGGICCIYSHVASGTVLDIFLWYPTITTSIGGSVTVSSTPEGIRLPIGSLQTANYRFLMVIGCESIDAYFPGISGAYLGFGDFAYPMLARQYVHHFWSIAAHANPCRIGTIYEASVSQDFWPFIADPQPQLKGDYNIILYP